MNSENIHTLEAQPTTQERSPVLAGVTRFLNRSFVHAIIILVSLVWLTPTVGLLVSSFRPANLVATTGWWAGGPRNRRT